jgi:hypothetical protein
MARPSPLKLICLFVLGFAISPRLACAAELLVYQGNNKWVAAQENAPLTRLLNQARQGTTHFLVRCPNAGRLLCLARLDVLQDLLSKAAQQGVVLQEAVGNTPVPGNRVWVQAAEKH